MKRKYVFIGLAAVAVIAAVSLAPLFLPKSGQTFDEGLPPGTAGSDPGAPMPGAATDNDSAPTGNPLTGRDGHSASGSVRLLEADGKHFLRFENVEQTQGPDVYLYLTKAPDAWGRADHAAAAKILVPQGDDGQFTARGTFNVEIPSGIDVSEYAGVLTWCDRFGVAFSSAAL